MEGQEIVKERILNALDMCNVKEEEDYLEIELPIVLLFNQQLLTLRLYPYEDYYYVSTLDTMFDEYPEYSADYCMEYYDLFVSNNSNYHYDIKQYEGYLYKKYSGEYSARYAIDDFVRFFIHFDEWVLTKRNEE